MEEKLTYGELTNDVKKFDDRSDSMPVPVDDQKGTFMSLVERLATNPDVDVSKIKQIMEIEEHVLDRNAEQAFNAAMTRAQNKIELVVAKSDNVQTRSKYADLKAVLLSAKSIYTTEGFSLMFYEGETKKENHIRVCVDIMHEQGCTKKRYADMAVQTTGIGGKTMMTQIHGEGSAFMYGRRYLTCMIFNIPTGEDDDGNAAGGKIDLLEQWMIRCNEAGNNAKSADEIATWWKQNSPVIKKELSKANAAKIYAKVNTYNKKLMPEPGSNG